MKIQTKIQDGHRHQHKPFKQNKKSTDIIDVYFYGLKLRNRYTCFFVLNSQLYINSEIKIQYGCHIKEIHATTVLQ